MTEKQLKNKLKKYAQVYYSLEWNLKLLEELNDSKNYNLSKELREEYKRKIYSLMREYKINEINIDVTKSVTLTFKV